MIQISDRVTNLSPSQTLAMSQKSAELKAQGVDVINLSVGEPDFNTPDHIKAAAEKAIEDNFTFYTPVAGYMSLRKAIADNLRQVNGVEYAPEQIVVGGGAKQALCNAVLSIVNPGDEVIIPTPAWVSYVEIVKLAEGTNVLVPAGIDQDFKITPNQLRDAITARTRLIIICSPSNPTGSVYTRDELQGLVDVLKDYPDITISAHKLYRQLHIAWRIPRDSRPGGGGKRCQQGLCHDRLAHRFYSRADARSQGCHKTAKPVHLKPVVCGTESRRGCLQRTAGLCRGNACCL